ncbi:RNA-binding protein FXR1-like isoform X2 [Symsagittifera roscoffensis]|uniref:RNA-binding protein FXR1-like isoform X2 n=1 Tax=Symsagittifera roscoffensis TaxID=84072 RepID=UPI00307C061A
MLKVEIRNDNSAYYKGFIVAIKDDTAKVKYESSTQEHVVPFNYLREPSETSNLDIGLLQLQEELEVFVTTRDNEPAAWWRARVKKKGDTWIQVDVLLPDGQTTPEVVSNGTFRRPSKKPPLTKDSFQVFEFPCDDNRILELAKDEANHTDFCALVGPCLVLPANDTLLAISLDPTVHKKINLLFETHFRFLRARSELFADIERANHKLEQTKLCGSSGITETFTIKQEFVGLAIGGRGVNISAARDIPGVSTVELHQQSGDPNVYEVVINGESEASIKKARAMLEFVEEPVMVPEELISRVIGRNGRMLQEIVDKTQVIKIRIEDGAPPPPPNPNATPGELDAPQEHMVPLWCIGSREAFELAKMMIEYKIKTLKDLESVKDERDKLNNQLQNQGVAAVSRLGPPFRGGGYGRPRGERGGGGYSRGGPRGGAMPIRGQPFRGGGRGGNGGGMGMRGGGPPPNMRGGRGGPPRRSASDSREPIGNTEIDQHDDRPPRGRGGGGGFRARGGRGRGGGGSQFDTGRLGGRVSGDVGADGDKRNNNNRASTNGPQDRVGAEGGNVQSGGVNGASGGAGETPATSSSSRNATSGGSGGGNQRRSNNGPHSKGGDGGNSSQQGAKPQRNRHGSGEAGKKRTHDGDEDSSHLNGNDGGHDKGSLPNGNITGKAPVNGVKA